MVRLLALGLIVLFTVGCNTTSVPQAVNFEIRSVAPGNGAVATAAATVISARFSTDVAVGTLGDGFLLDGSGGAVAGTVAYARASRSATFIPDSALTPGIYTATLTTGVRSESGVRLSDSRTWTFEVIPGSDTGPPIPTDPVDPAIGDLPTVAYLSPTPNRRIAGLVAVEADLLAPLGIRRAELTVVGEGGAVRVRLLEVDPDGARISRQTLTALISTVDFEAGLYTLTIELEDVAGNVAVRTLDVEFMTPFLITTPTYGEGVGSGRQIVAVTIGVNGTIRDDYGVSRIDLFINGALYAADVPIDMDATSTRLAVYPWDTFVAGPGHPVGASGDRMLTARIWFVDPVSSTARYEFTPGVLVNYQP